MKIVKGIQTTLVEVSESDAEDMINLRNDPKNNKYLYQKHLTIEDQINWIRENKKKTDTVNFKVLNVQNEFTGTISIYDIKNDRGEFGRYIVNNAINAVESEYLLLKFCFNELKLKTVYCQTNIENKKSWKLHLKLGFKPIETKKVLVGSAPQIYVDAYIQEINKAEFENFNYEKIFDLLRSF
jgi:RimJ/RimL family protein N-acetyltransferase